MDGCLYIECFCCYCPHMLMHKCKSGTLMWIVCLLKPVWISSTYVVFKIIMSSFKSYMHTYSVL